jgi:hypothetical protein
MRNSPIARPRQARTRRTVTGVEAVGAALILSAGGAALLPGHAFGAGPTVRIPPGPFTNGQTISLSGSGFPTHGQDPTGLQVIECSDPQGAPANLPTDATSCDGVTVNPAQINTDASGRFTAQYQLSVLSSRGSGTSSNIDCDGTHQCVLWVGVDYNNAFISGPHAFSGSFVVNGTAGQAPSAPTTPSPGIGNTASPPGSVSATGSPGSAVGGVGNGASNGSSAGGSAGSPSGGNGPGVPSMASGTLAYTGVPGALLWILGFGVLMVLSGAVGRRLTKVPSHG